MTNSGQELEQLVALLSSQEWRIFSGKIYSIKDKHGKKIPFIPNAFQKDFYQRKHTKNIILKARQLGFSTLIDIMALDKVLFSKYKSVGIIADDRDSAELIFRDKVKFAYDNLPSWIFDTFQVKTDRKGELVFENNHCSIAVDTSFRGGTLQSLHISEYGKICNKYPDKAREIQTGALNTVAPTSEVFIESTAEGNSGYFYDMCMRAMAQEEMGRGLTDMDYKFFFYPWYIDETYELTDDFPITQETCDYFATLKQNEYIQKHFPHILFGPEKMRWWQKKKEEQGDDMIREYPSFPKEAFDIAIKGAYYEKELGIAREQKRIANIYHDERLPVYTSWDLGGSGGGDDTAIWFWQIYGKELRIIDYWEGTGYSMIEIANTIVNPRYKNYDIHYFPHDGNVHEYSTGATRVETARQHLRGKVEAVKMSGVSEGINNVRNMFPNCYFDEAKCSKGLGQLAKYRRKYDERNGMFLDRPEHKDSHGCFIAGTKVLTQFGLKEIQNIEKGDYVFTSNGLRKVLNVFNNGIKRVNTYHFSNGSKVTCTPDHLFSIKGRYKEIDSIRYMSIMDHINNTTIWKCILNILTEENINSGNDKNIYQVATGKGCTQMFGGSIIEKFQNDTISIIRTITRSIMIFLISNVLKLHNIFQSIEEKNGKMKIEQKEGETDLIKQEKKQRNGIEVMSDYNGIKNIFGTIKIIYLKRKNILAFSVLRSIYRTGMSLLNFVLITASRLIERNRELMTRKELVLAEMITFAINTHSERNVDLVSKEYHGEEFVYDIEVEGVHNYYANGFLVHNCDAFRYLANVYAELTKHKAQAITYEADYSEFY